MVKRSRKYEGLLWRKTLKGWLVDRYVDIEGSEINIVLLDICII